MRFTGSVKSAPVYKLSVATMHYMASTAVVISQVHTGNKVEFDAVDFVESRPRRLGPIHTGDKLTVSATKSTELATVSTTTSCWIQVVVDLSPKLATKSTVSETVDFVADLSAVSATVNFVAGVYRALHEYRQWWLNVSFRFCPGGDTSTHSAANIFHCSRRQRCACIWLRLRLSRWSASVLWHQNGESGMLFVGLCCLLA